jgi:hypothetical protein
MEHNESLASSSTIDAMDDADVRFSKTGGTDEMTQDFGFRSIIRYS